MRRPLRDEVLRRTVLVGLEDVRQVSRQRIGLRKGDGEGKLEAPVVAVGRGRRPAPGDVLHRHVRGLLRRIEGGQEDDDHDDHRRVHGGQRGIVERQAAQQVPLRQAHGDELAGEVPEYGAEGGEYGRFGDEKGGDVVGRQAHRAVHADLPEPFEHGAHHGVQHEERRDEHRDDQVGQARDRSGAQGTVDLHFAFHADEHGQEDTRHKGLHGIAELVAVREPRDRHGPRGSVQVEGLPVGQDQHVARWQVLRRLDRGHEHLHVHFGQAAGHGETGGHDALVVHVPVGVEALGIEQSDHRIPAAQDLHFRRAHVVGPHVQPFGQFRGQQAHRPFVGAEPSPARQQVAVQPGNGRFAGVESEKGPYRGGGSPPRRAQVDVGTREIFGFIPGPRHYPGPFRKGVFHVRQEGSGQSMPRQAAHEDAIVRRTVLAVQRIELDTGPEGGEGEHGEGQQGQRHRRQRRAHLPLAQVRYPERYGHRRGAQAADVRLVESGRRPGQVLHLRVEPRDDHGNDDERHGQDDEGEEDHVGRQAELKGGVHVLQQHENGGEDHAHREQPFPNVREPEEEPLEEEAEGHEQHEIEHDAVHRVVRGVPHVGIGAGLVAPRFSRPGREGVVAPVIEGFPGGPKRPRAFLVEFGGPGVGHAVVLQLHQPCPVERPQVQGALVEGVEDQSLFRRESTPLRQRHDVVGDAFRRIGKPRRRRVGQQVLDAPGTRAHEHLDPVPGPGEDHRGVGHPVAEEALVLHEGRAVLAQRTVVPAEDGQVVEGDENPRIHDVEEVDLLAGKEDLYGIVHLGGVRHREGEGGVALFTQVRGVHDPARVVEAVTAQLYRAPGVPDHGKTEMTQRVRVRDHEPPNAGVALVARLVDHQGIGYRGIGLEEIHGAVELQDPALDVAAVVFQPDGLVHLEGLGVRKHGRQQGADGPDLTDQVGEIDVLDPVQGRVYEQPVVVRRGEGHAVQPGERDHLVVEGGSRGHVAFLRPERGRQRVEVGRPAFLFIVGPGLARVVQVPVRVGFIQDVQIRGEEDVIAVAEQPDLVHPAGQIQAQEQREGDPVRLGYAFQEEFVRPIVAVQEVVYALHAVKMGGGGQEQHGVSRRMGPEHFHQFQHGGDTARALGARRQSGDDRHGVVEGRQHDDAVLPLYRAVAAGNRFVPARDPSHDVPGLGPLPRHAALDRRLDFTRLRGPCGPQHLRRVGIGNPEPRDVGGHVQDLALGLVVGHRARAAIVEQYGLRAQHPRVEILIAPVEIDQDDAPLDLFPVEGREFAPPAVMQGPPDPVGKGIQAHQVRPELIHRVFGVHGVVHGQREAMVHRRGYGEGVDGYLGQAPGMEGVDHVFHGRAVPRVADDARRVFAQRPDMGLDPLRGDDFGDFLPGHRGFFEGPGRHVVGKRDDPQDHVLRHPGRAGHGHGEEEQDADDKEEGSEYPRIHASLSRRCDAPRGGTTRNRRPWK